jgi:hypothetical protein
VSTPPEHPALESFADLDAAGHDAHVAACPRCSADLADQWSVRAVLAALPDPGPLPPGVRDRIDATLRDLSAGRVAGAAPGNGSAPGNAAAPGNGAATGNGAAPARVVPLRRRRRDLGWLRVAAAVLVVVAALGAGARALVGGGSSSSSTASAGSASAELRTGLSAPRSADPITAIASGTRYTTAGLASQVAAAQRREPAPGAAPGATGSDAQRGTSRVAGPLGTPAGVAGCLQALRVPAGTRPTLVDVATFDGSPAAVVVLPAEGGGQEVWVVATTCSPQGDGTRYFAHLG